MIGFVKFLADRHQAVADQEKIEGVQRPTQEAGSERGAMVRCFFSHGRRPEWNAWTDQYSRLALLRNSPHHARCAPTARRLSAMLPHAARGSSDCPG